MPVSITGDEAKKFVQELNKNLVKPGSGPVQMTAEEIAKLKTITDNVVALSVATDPIGGLAFRTLIVCAKLF